MSKIPVYSALARGWEYPKTLEFAGWWSIIITCLPGEEGIHKNVIIGASIGGGVFCLVIIAVSAFCLYKRRSSNLEKDNMLDKNPVYMYDYADPDENNEIYDTNAYYGVTDVDTEGSTVATDLNPDYE